MAENLKKIKNSLLVVIAGPTAVGKTNLTINLAKHYNTEIISADSRQFYKEISIGTAKPSEQELNEVKHHFINSNSIVDELSAGKYEEQAIQLLDKLFAEHSIVFLVGGSGLYIKALCEGMDMMPSVSDAIRQQLNTEFQTLGLSPLIAELEQSDKAYFDTVDIHNPQRVIRALEVIRTTGKPFSSFRKGNKKDRNFEILKLALNISRDELYSKINQRVDIMIENGLEQEVKALYQYKSLNALQTVGYKEMFDYLEQKITFEQAIELIKKNTRNYAKRQLTWFNKDKDYTWFEPDSIVDIMRLIDSKLNN